jgi:hypothetical protein
MYKIGDKVRIKSYDELKKMAKHIRHNGSLEGLGVSFNIDMKRHCGKTAIIIGKLPNDTSRLDIRNDRVWSSDMFEPARIPISKIWRR